MNAIRPNITGQRRTRGRFSDPCSKMRFGFHPNFTPPSYGPFMETLRPIPAVLISIEPGPEGGFRRRLLHSQHKSGVIETMVRITEINSHTCLVADCGKAPSENAQIWLKLPGREPSRILAVAESGGELVCQFLQPLHPAEVSALVPSPRTQAVRHSRFQPRCTLL